MAFLNEAQLRAFGFGAVGANVLISDKAAFYNAEKISIGDNTRIDDFCILSAGEGGITIGRHVHIACYVCLLGQGSITLHDFVGLSSRVSVFSSTDSFAGDALTGPTVPPHYRSVKSKPVVLRKHAIVGAGCAIMPGVTLEEGAAVGAMSLVTRDCKRFQIYGGVPARILRARGEKLLALEQTFRNEVKNGGTTGFA